MDRRVKRVIVARHGESEANKHGIHLGLDAHLTPLGIEQAERVARQFKLRGVEALMMSKESRTHLTAIPSAELLGVKPVATELLNEIRRPTHTIGQPDAHPLVQRTLESVRVHRSSGFHHRFSDEETLDEARVRVEKLLESWKNHEADVIGVFSHAHLTRMMKTVVETRFAPTPQRFFEVYDMNRLQNGAICVFEYSQAHKHTDWWWHCASWNETGHLLDLTHHD